MNSADPGTLVFIGPMGAGKTSIGRKVARALRTRFTDTDREVVRAHGPIPEIFAREGERVFRSYERTAVRHALARDGVVALGGGAITHPETLSDLRARRVVLLTVSPHTVAGRIAGDARPLLAAPDPMARWNAILAERLPLYREVADLEIDTSRGPVSAVVDTIARWARSDAPATTAPKENP